jgi:transposase
VLATALTIATAPRAVDPATGWLISPIVAASLCIKPRGLLTSDQAAKVDALKSASPDFTAMRRLAMRFRGILRSKDIQKFDVWLNDAQQSGIYAIHRFARTLRRDVDAVRNSLTEGWSNGQAEGQINRLKTLKRAMYGRARTELLRARMLPLHLPSSTESEAGESAGRFFDQVSRHVLERREVGGSIFGSHAAFIVAKDHVHDPMQAVFHRPMRPCSPSTVSSLHHLTYGPGQ